MSLWTCPKHGLYAGQVFCPQCGENGDWTTVDPEVVANDEGVGASSGSRPTGQVQDGPGASRFDPARMEARLSDLLALEANWNSYQARPVNPDCAERVRRFYPVMERLGLQPWITPDTDGGLTIERGGTDDYSVEFNPDGAAAVWFDGLSDRDAWALVGLFAQMRALDAIAI